jgi:hypothetical protein
MLFISNALTILAKDRGAGDSLHHGLHAIVVAGILSLLAAVPESPAKPKPEKYDLTQ